MKIKVLGLLLINPKKTESLGHVFLRKASCASLIEVA